MATILTEDQLLALISTNITDNITGDIAPADDRAVRNAMVCSLLPTQTSFFNNTGVTISKGSVINASGINVANNIVEGILANAAIPSLNVSIIGLCAQDVLDQEIGVAIDKAPIENLDTSALSPLGGIVYLDPLNAGKLTKTKPLYPNARVILGTITKVDASTGIIEINITRLARQDATRSYPWTSRGLSSGEHWLGGFYDWNGTDANLTQGIDVQYGDSTTAYAAHVGIVPSGPGTVDTGVIGLRAVGIMDSETGPQIAAQTSIISEDITTLTVDTLYETSALFSGEFTIEFYTVSGSPTTYSLDFNYGYSQYDDFSSRDATILSFEVDWNGDGTDNNFDVELFLHQNTGWTYAAIGFEPGNGKIAQRLVNQQLAGDVANDVNGKWVASSLNQIILGSSGGQGFLMRVSNGIGNSIQIMNATISAVSEELEA
mgnify:CR=1 FL=1